VSMRLGYRLYRRPRDYLATELLIYWTSATLPLMKVTFIPGKKSISFVGSVTSLVGGPNMARTWALV